MLWRRALRGLWVLSSKQVIPLMKEKVGKEGEEEKETRKEEAGGSAGRLGPAASLRSGVSDPHSAGGKQEGLGLACEPRPPTRRVRAESQACLGLPPARLGSQRQPSSRCIEPDCRGVAGSRPAH